MAFSKAELSEGWLVLQKMLPEAREKVAAGMKPGKILSGLAKAMLPYIKESNMEAVMIHQLANGGWMADLYFKNCPPGINNVLGTSVKYPLKTREEAYDRGVLLVAIALNFEKQRPQDRTGSTEPAGKPVFIYYDVEVTLEAELLSLLENMGADSAYCSREFAITRLREVTKTLFPKHDNVTARDIDGLNEDARRSLWAVIHLATFKGILRFPEIVVGEPGTEPLYRR